MKKLFSLLMLMVCTVATWAAILPEAGKIYKMHCAAIDGHETRQYLWYNSEGNVNYNSEKGSYFVFEQGAEAGKWKIKETVSGKYLVVTANTAGTPITLSEEASTYWTTSEQSNGIRFLPNGTEDVFMNNNSAFALKTGQGGCSSWVLEEQTDIVKGATGCIETGWYFIEIGNGKAQNHATYQGYFLQGVKNGNWGITLTQTLGSFSSYVYVDKKGDNDYNIIFNKGTSQQYTVGQTSQVNNTPGSLQFKAKADTNDNFQFNIWGENNRLMGWTIGGIPSVGNTSTTGGDNDECYFIFHKTEQPTTVNVTYTYKCDGLADIVIVKTQEIGSDFVAPETPVFGTVNSLSATGTVSADNKTCVVNYTLTLPFVPGYVYRLKVRNEGDGKYVSYGNAKPKTTAETASNFALENLWTIERVEGTINDFKLYNLGASQYLNGNGFSAAGKAYTIGKFAARNEQSFNFVVSGTTNNCIGDHVTANTELGEWNGGSNKNDNGSCFWVEDITSEISALTTIGNPKYLGEGYEVNADAKSVAQATPTKENVSALFVPVNFADVMSANKYYRISAYDTSRSGGNWLGSTSFANVEGVIQTDGRKLQSNDTVGGVAALFQFEESNGAYYITHVNSGLSVCNTTQNDKELDFPISKENAGTFTFNNVQGKWWSIKTKTANEWLHQSNHGDKKIIIWNATPTMNNCQASLWSIEEVTTIPLTVKTSKWASACYPVAVTLPTELTGYYASSEEGEYLILTEIEGKVIPANTAVFITTSEELTESKVYNLTIGGESANIENNILKGTTVERRGFDSASGTRYGLSDGLLKKVTGDVIAANKAYYESASANVAAFQFLFDGVSTGVELNASTEKGTYYDLNGRPVVNPVSGVYVINGNKVFVK